jgi:hypothetical protein
MPPLKLGRPPALDIQALVQPCEHTWQVLIGAKPGKRNQRFHTLLQAAAITVMGRLDREPDWEGQIVAAKARKARGKLDPTK